MLTWTAVRAAALSLALVLVTSEPATAAGELAAAKAQEAAAALLRGSVEQAVLAYSEALQDQDLAPDRRAAILNDRGVANSRLGRHKAALDDFNQAVRLFPEYAPVYNNRANTLLALGLVEEAIKDLNRAIVLAPGYAAAYNNRASALLKLGRPEEAALDYTRAIRLAPQSAASLTGRGQALLAQGRPYSALTDFRRAIALDGRSAAAHRAQARAAMQVGHFEDAIENLSRAIALEPENAELHIDRGEAYRFAENTPSALRDFNRALEIDPQSARALAGRALALAKTASFEEAEADLAAAIEIDPRSAEAFAYRAWLYKQTGQPELGLREVEKALTISKDNPDVYWAKGEVEHALGQRDDAIESFRTALRLMPSHTDASLALQQMGVASDFQEDVPAAAMEGWRVVKENGRYAAYLKGRSKVRVPLEVAGDAEPRLLAWEVKDGVLKGIGLLRYYAGTVQAESGPEQIEQIAIVDIPASKVVSLQLHRQGDRESVWSWNEGTVTIENVDGVTDVLVLRDTTPREVARRPVAEREGVLGFPAWAPWNQDYGYRQRPRRPSRSRPPRTIFDLIFGN
nr:MAG: hypothetical protein DIU57_07405 [Pseudomonadota bacterium]